MVKMGTNGDVKIMAYKNAIIFDFETTGLSSYSDQIIEVGLLNLEIIDGKFVATDELSCLVQTERPLPLKIIEITHITDEMLLREGITEKKHMKN